MDLIVFHLSNVNWWAVVFATLASFMLGFVWYSEALFGKSWMKAVGLKKKDMENANMTTTFTVTGLLSFAMATGLAMLMCALQFNNWRQGAVFGALVGLVFLAANRGIHSLYEQKTSSSLYLINAGYDVVYLILAGAIIGAL